LDYELSVLKEIVSVDTDVTKKTGYSQCADLISKRMSDLGLKIDILDPAEKAGDGISRPSVIGTLDVGAKETIGLVTHYDVVPPGVNWKKDPFAFTVEDGRAYGRGTSDDKSSIAASLGAVKQVGRRAKFNVKIIASPEEEIGGTWGIGYVLSEGVMFDSGVIVDSSPDMIGIGASGIVQGEIRVFGKQGHAGYPHNANNAVMRLVELISAFDAFAEQRGRKLSKANAPPGSPKEKVWGRISFTMIGGGEKENIIPGEAWTRFDMRLLPEEAPSAACAELEDFLNQKKNEMGLDAKLAYLKIDDPYLTDPSCPLVRRFSEASKAVFGSPLPAAASLGGDDGKFLFERGIPVISYGAIAEDSNFHGKDEFVRLDDLQRVRDVLASFIGSSHP
jgi:succinyl-diaminopimelate desuccinylase